MGPWRRFLARFGLAATTLATPAPVLAEDATPAERTAADVAAFCDIVRERYAYFATRKAHWSEACKAAVKNAASVETGVDGLVVFEGLIDALFDHHANLGVNHDASPRLVPSNLGAWLAFDGDRVVVQGVRRGGGADRAGVLADETVLAIHGMDPKDAVASRIRQGRATPERRAWALNAAMAGYRDVPRSLTVERGGQPVTIELGEPEPPGVDAPVSWDVRPDGVGVVRFNNSLGDTATVSAFDNALAAMGDVPGLVIDLRDTPGGGDTAVAEPILARFVTKPTPYQRTVPLNEDSFVRSALPRAPLIDAPTVALVGRWTGSMGEGMAVGFDALGITVMGTPMAGLAGGVEGFTLPATGIPVSLPTYDLTHMNGTPRHVWVPPVFAPSDPGGPADPALDQAAAAARGAQAKVEAAPL